MEDLTTWKINGLELPLDIEDADTVEKYESAMEQLEADFQRTSPTVLLHISGHIARHSAHCTIPCSGMVQRHGFLQMCRIMSASIPQCTVTFWRLSQNRLRSLRRRWCRFAANICRKAENGESAL